MTKIHVLTQKEAIDPLKIKNCVVVVFDVLLATTTITTLLQHGAKKIIPVLNAEEALAVSRQLPQNSFILSGEENGYALDDFIYPCPLELIDSDIEAKTIIFSTTNGTVALKNSLDASFVYAACLLNGASVAQYLLKSHRDKSILLVCSGNHGRFSMEDFIGAGHLINALHRNTESLFHLSDAAILAYKFYQQCQQNQIVEYLLTSQTGKLLTSIGYERSIFHAAQHDIYPIVPVVRKGDYPYLEIAGS